MRRYMMGVVLGLAVLAALSATVRAQGARTYITLVHKNAELPTPIAAGGAAGPGVSGIQVQNVGAAPSTSATGAFYGQSGSAPVSLALPSLGPLNAGNIYLPTNGDLTDGLYAGIFSGDMPLAAVARTEWPRTGGAVLFSGSRPSTRVIVPLVACNAHGQTSYVSVQNTDETAAAVAEVKVFETGSLVAAAGHRLSIPRGTSVTFEPCFDGTMQGKVGYLTAASNTPLTAQAFVNIATSGQAVYAFEGVPAEDAANRLFVPLFRNDYYGTTGISVVNPGAEAADVTVQFNGSLSRFSGISCQGRTFTLGPVTLSGGASVVLYQGPASGNPVPNDCAGSAEIQATGGKVVAIVNDAAGANPAAPSTSAAYNAISLSQAGRRVSLPLYRNSHTKARLDDGDTGHERRRPDGPRRGHLPLVRWQRDRRGRQRLPLVHDHRGAGHVGQLVSTEHLGAAAERLWQRVSRERPAAGCYRQRHVAGGYDGRGDLQRGQRGHGIRAPAANEADQGWACSTGGRRYTPTHAGADEHLHHGAGSL